jgi:predicted thioredoxin/glutaredoxin
MGKPNPQNLNPCNSENARERQLKSAEKRKENNAKKKLMSQIYAEFLEREYEVKAGEGKRKLSGAELVNEVMRKVLARSDSSSVSLIRELRSCLDGENINLSGQVNTTLNLSQEERLKLFEEITK